MKKKRKLTFIIILKLLITACRKNKTVDFVHTWQIRYYTSYYVISNIIINNNNNTLNTHLNTSRFCRPVSAWKHVENTTEI